MTPVTPMQLLQTNFQRSNGAAKGTMRFPMTLQSLELDAYQSPQENAADLRGHVEGDADGFGLFRAMRWAAPVGVIMWAGIVAGVLALL